MKSRTGIDSWRETLKAKYHHFAGNYHKLADKDPYRSYVARKRMPDGSFTPVVQLKMAPPVASSPPSFFNAEEYAKHLIGNVCLGAVSVSVILHYIGAV